MAAAKIVEAVAQQLWKVWAEAIDYQIELEGFTTAESSWDTLPEVQKRAWVILAQHVINASRETFIEWIGLSNGNREDTE